MRFSERYGYKPVRDAIQLESIDEELLNGLWNVLQIHVWEHVRRSTGMYSGYYLSANPQHRELCRRLWLHHFKHPLDTLENDWPTVLDQLRKYFFRAEWHEVYDFVEFVGLNYERYDFRGPYIEACNALLEREMSAYRLVDGVVTRIVHEQEIAKVEEALQTVSSPVATHLRRALELMPDRSNPDYRNSVKESICAVRVWLPIRPAVLGERSAN